MSSPPPPEALPDRPGTFRFQGSAFPTPIEGSHGGLTQQILDFARGPLGAAAAAVTHAGPLSEDGHALKRWLQNSFGDGLDYMTGRGREDPRSLLPEAQSIVVVAYAYPSWRGLDGSPPIAHYALGSDYHGLLKERLLRLGQQCAQVLGTDLIGRPCVDTAPLLERAVAQRAGMGFQGKSTLTIIPGVGSRVLLGELLLSVALPEIDPGPPEAGCGDCSLCLSACPTNAFHAPYQLDARRCVSYLTIEHPGVIPLALRAGIGNRIFGCDLCQQVCPFNQSRKLSPSHKDLLPRAESAPNEALGLLEIRSGQYRRLVRRSALSRVSRRMLQRNAAIALGNSGSEDAVPALARALQNNQYPLVRRHVAWALGRLGGAAAQQALEKSGRSEADPDVVGEIRDALKEARSAAATELAVAADPGNS